MIPVIVGAYLIFQPPSRIDVVRETRIAPNEGQIDCKEVQYSATWGDRIVYSGDVRHISEANFDQLPMVTHDVLLTTGQFSDPEIVKVDPVRDGHTRWRARGKPDGTLMMLHLIPENEAVFQKLKRIDRWDGLEFSGREEDDHSIEGSDGSHFRVNRSLNHLIFLLSDVRPLENHP